MCILVNGKGKCASQAVYTPDCADAIAGVKRAEEKGFLAWRKRIASFGENML